MTPRKERATTEEEFAICFPRTMEGGIYDAARAEATSLYHFLRHRMAYQWESRIQRVRLRGVDFDSRFETWRARNPGPPRAAPGTSTMMMLPRRPIEEIQEEIRARIWPRGITTQPRRYVEEVDTGSNKEGVEAITRYS